MQLHARCPGLEIWCPRGELGRLNNAAWTSIVTFLSSCAASLQTLFAVDDTNRILERAMACVATEENHASFEAARSALLQAFAERMRLLRAQGLFRSRHEGDGMPWCQAVRGPFLEVTDPALVREGFALPAFTLQSRCQTVALTIRRSRDFFPPEYKRMVDEPHTPAIVLQFWLAATDNTRLERHLDALEALASALTTQLSTVLHTHRRRVAESF